MTCWKCCKLRHIFSCLTRSPAISSSRSKSTTEFLQLSEQVWDSYTNSLSCHLAFGLCNIPATIFIPGNQEIIVFITWMLSLSTMSRKTQWNFHQRWMWGWKKQKRFGQKVCAIFGMYCIYRWIASNPRLLKSICGIPMPNSIHEVMSFLGLVSYHRLSTEKFTNLAMPLKWMP